MIIYVPLISSYNRRNYRGGTMSNINIFIAGDSTASDYDKTRSPRAGWGQMLEKFLTSKAIVHNHASSGRSSKSFLDEGRLKAIDDQLCPGDYFLIQFGHNDSKKEENRYTEPFSSYKDYLKKYIEVARKKRAFPILITSIERRSFNENGILKETHGRYPDAMRELAQEEDVPLIDLTVKSKNLFEQLGSEQTKEIFLWLVPRKCPNYPDGVQDNTHFSEYGAQVMAQLVIEGMREQKLPLAQFIKGATHDDND